MPTMPKSWRGKPLRTPIGRVLEIAIEEALKSEVKRSKHSALGLDSRLRNVLSRTHNTRVFGYKNKWTLHAEERLLAKIREPLHTMLICRVMGNRSFGNSKPCPRCMQLLQESGVKRVIFWQGGVWTSLLLLR